MLKSILLCWGGSVLNKKLIVTAIAVLLLGVVSANNTNLHNIEYFSPSDNLKSTDINVFKDKAVINKEDLIWAKIKDTHSMEPVLNKDSITLEIVPKDYSEIHLGDIISFEHEDYVIIHRVIDINKDEQGVYFTTKGDNNEIPDPYKVRFSQVKGLVVGILY